MGDRTSGFIKELAHAYELVPQWSKRVHWKNPKIKYVIQQLVVDEADEGLLVIYTQDEEHKNVVPRARNLIYFLEI